MKGLLLAMALAATLNSTIVEAAVKKQVTFNSAGIKLSGHLYLPNSYQNGERLPGVVVTGAWTSVKEQMAGTYAATLADKGFATLAFDFRGWGQSPDKVQYLENPSRKMKDIHAAVNFLVTLPEVDPHRVAGLGICASAGYMAEVASKNSHLKSVALIAPWLHDMDIVKDVYGGEDGVSKLIEIGRNAEKADTPIIIEAASTTNAQALMYQAPYYTEPARGLIPEYDNRFNVASWEGWLTYDAMSSASELEKPVLLVHSDKAAIPQGAKKYAALIGKHATKAWLADVTQFDFYDRPDIVAKATSTVSEHFHQTLQ